MRAKFVTALGLVGALVITGAVFWHGQRVKAQEQYTREQLSAELANMIADEAAQMHTWLRIALREPVPCDGPCNRDEDFSRIVELMQMRCDRIAPELQDRSPHYNAKVHGKDLGRLKAACAILRSGAAKLGRPTERPEWVQHVAQAKAALEK